MVLRTRDTHTGLQGMAGEWKFGEARREVWMQCLVHSGDREAQTS